MLQEEENLNQTVAITEQEVVVVVHIPATHQANFN